MLNGEFLLDFRSRSFFMGAELVCEFLVLFFKLSDSGWVSLTVGEGEAEFLVMNSEPLLVGRSEIEDDFAYPVQPLSGLSKYLGLKILSVFEYRVSGVDDDCVGVYLDFGDCGLSVVELGGCLLFEDGVFQFKNDTVVSLVKIL